MATSELRWNLQWSCVECRQEKSRRYNGSVTSDHHIRSESGRYRLHSVRPLHHCRFN